MWHCTTSGQPMPSIKKQKKRLHSYCTLHFLQWLQNLLFQREHNSWYECVSLSHVHCYMHHSTFYTTFDKITALCITGFLFLSPTCQPILTVLSPSTALCASIMKMKETAVHRQRPDGSLRECHKSNCQQCKGRPKTYPREGLWQERLGHVCQTRQRGIFGFQESLSHENNVMTGPKGQTQLGLEILQSRCKDYKGTFGLWEVWQALMADVAVGWSWKLWPVSRESWNYLSFW